MEFNKADAIIVMGRGIKQDGSLPDGPKLRGKLAVSLYEKKLAPILVLTSKYWGFQNFIPPITEDEAMKRFVITLGVPEDKTLKQEISEDTIGEAFFTKIEIIDAKQWKKLIIVTSTDHLQRTKYIFEQIFGPKYDLQFAAADHGLTEEVLMKSQKLEERAFKVAKRYLKNITPGDTEQVKNMIFKKHAMYNGSLLKPIMKLILRKQPYNY